MLVVVVVVALCRESVTSCYCLTQQITILLVCVKVIVILSISKKKKKFVFVSFIMFDKVDLDPEDWETFRQLGHKVLYCIIVDMM